MCVLDSVHVEGRGTRWEDLAQLPESGEIQLCRPQSSGVVIPLPPSATRTSHGPRLRQGGLGLLRNWVQLLDTLGVPCGTQTIDQGVPALSIGQSRLTHLQKGDLGSGYTWGFLSTAKSSLPRAQ